MPRHIGPPGDHQGQPGAEGEESRARAVAVGSKGRLGVQGRPGTASLAPAGWNSSGRLRAAGVSLGVGYLAPGTQGRGSPGLCVTVGWVGAAGSGLVGLCMEGMLAGKSFAISRNQLPSGEGQSLSGQQAS